MEWIKVSERPFIFPPSNQGVHAYSQKEKKFLVLYCRILEGSSGRHVQWFDAIKNATCQQPDYWLNADYPISCNDEIKAMEILLNKIGDDKKNIK